MCDFKPIVRIISVKVHMHCDKCEADLKSRLIKHKGIFDVKTDKKAQSVTVEGTIEVEKLMLFLRKRVHKNAEIISIKEENKKGKEEGKSSENTKEKDNSKSGESTKKKDDNNKSGESTKEKEGKFGESTKEKGDGKSNETTKIIETHQGHPKEEIKLKDNVPYIIHYVYAPQLFSDENPNSCSIS
ncbi:Heavy metal-associated isoprenylated plant protein 4, partial [Mucuna pruriens]